MKDDRFYFNNLMLLKKHFTMYKDRIEPKLDMRVYHYGDGPTDFKIKTAGCILGHSIEIRGLQEHITIYNKQIQFEAYAKSAFNIGKGSPNWNLLFGTFNPNSVDYFLEKLDGYLTEHYLSFTQELK